MLGILRGFLRGARRTPLTGKTGPIGFYKGRGAKSTGFNTRKGRFIVMKEKIPEFVVPDLTGFKLRPYVSRLNYKPKDLKPPTPEDYLELVRAKGVDAVQVRSAVRVALSRFRDRSKEAMILRKAAAIERKMRRSKEIQEKTILNRIRKQPRLYFEVTRDRQYKDLRIDFNVAEGRAEDALNELDVEEYYDEKNRKRTRPRTRKVVDEIVTEEEKEADRLRLAMDEALKAPVEKEEGAEEGDEGQLKAVGSIAAWLKAEGVARKAAMRAQEERMQALRQSALGDTAQMTANAHIIANADVGARSAPSKVERQGYKSRAGKKK
eukprot:Opistho-1_new@21710